MARQEACNQLGGTKGAVRSRVVSSSLTTSATCVATPPRLTSKATVRSYPQRYPSVASATVGRAAKRRHKAINTSSRLAVSPTAPERKPRFIFISKRARHRTAGYDQVHPMASTASYTLSPRQAKGTSDRSQGHNRVAWRASSILGAQITFLSVLALFESHRCPSEAMRCPAGSPRGAECVKSKKPTAMSVWPRLLCTTECLTVQMNNCQACHYPTTSPAHKRAPVKSQVQGKRFPVHHKALRHREF